MIYVKFKKLSDTAILPTKGSQGAAGYDLYADLTSSIKLKPMEIRMIDTGISVEIPPDYSGDVYARSGLSTKRGLTLINGVGIIDPDYRGSIHVPLINLSGTTQEIAAHERIAQLIIRPAAEIKIIEADELSPTERGAGGFGSTGRE